MKIQKISARISGISEKYPLADFADKRRKRRRRRVSGLVG